jgi:signal transduction histidine kinase
MRERVRQLGGSMEIVSSTLGTTVTAVISLKEGGER